MLGDYAAGTITQLISPNMRQFNSGGFARTSSCSLFPTVSARDLIDVLIKSMSTYSVWFCLRLICHETTEGPQWKAILNIDRETQCFTMFTIYFLCSTP